MLLLALAALAVLDGPGPSPASTTYRLAVEGDTAGAAAVLDALGAGRLRPEAVEDAAVAVASGADAGLVLPPDADGIVARGDPLTVTLITDATTGDSRTAGVETRVALAGLTAPLPAAVRIERRDAVPPEPAGDETVDLLAQGAAGLVLVQGGVLVGTSAARLAGRRATGLLAPTLTLPVPRLRLVAGRVAADTTLGLVAGSPLLALAALAVVVAGVADERVGAGVVGVVVVGVAAAAVALPLVTTGVLIGARARSSQQVSTLASVGLVVVAVAARWVALAPDAPPAWVAALPIVGPAAVVRQAAATGADPVALAAAVAGSLVTSLLIARRAAAALDREHLALRSA